MSYARFVDPVLAALPPGLFDEVVTGDAVSRGKPHPEPYLTAARLLGVAPERLPGHRGLRAGHHERGRGRLHRLVVPLHVPVAPGERRVHLDTLQGVDHALLRSLAPVAG